MPLTRRLFLNRIGATTAAAAAVAMPPAACSVIPDDAELVSLGKKMERAQARFVEADDAYRSALARAQALAPPVPEGLIVDSRYQYQGHTERERGIDHEAMPNCRWLLTERHLTDEAEFYAGLPGKVARRNEDAARKLLTDRAAYAAGMDTARQASGYMPSRYRSGADCYERRAMEAAGPDIPGRPRPLVSHGGTAGHGWALGAALQGSDLPRERAGLGRVFRLARCAAHSKCGGGHLVVRMRRSGRQHRYNVLRWAQRWAQGLIG